MARLHLAPLLLFVTVSAVVVSAVDKPSRTTSSAPTTTTPTNGDVNVAEAPGNVNAIGTTDNDAAATTGDDDVAVAGPMGSDPPPQQASGSGATATVGIAYVAAATVGSLFFL